MTEVTVRAVPSFSLGFIDMRSPDLMGPTSKEPVPQLGVLELCSSQKLD